MPHMPRDKASGASYCVNTEPITAGGAMVMNQAGRMRSGSGLWAMRRTSTIPITMGQKKVPMPIWAVAQTSWPRGKPASGETTFPTTGISSTGVTPGHKPVCPGLALGTGASQRPSTHTVAHNCVSAPTHHTALSRGWGPNKATPTAAINSVATGKAATNAWRTGCLRSSSSATG